ncbi:hypothetical protein C1645_46652 [Glomus cerebriforme]|uniref:Uncharacterized protein n=1 Tax=Glomus cerebriforme TaxID=658196 RepID=A0A397T399_9GLOM|nr:hypothetical protein C1645_46652 [Glomus cerebriforme]
MKVTRLQLGVYANQQPFCLYLFPLVTSSPSVSSQNGQDSPSRTTHQLFYRLRDIDAIFFESQEIGYILKSGKIPQIYFDTPGYCFRERSSDVYLAARAIKDTGTRLGNHLLAEFCKYSQTEIISGMANKLLESVDVTRTSVLDAEFEFIPLDSTYTPTTSPISNNTPLIRSPNNLNSSTSNGHLSPPPTNGRKRMSLEAVLDNDDNTNNRRYASTLTSPVERIVSPVGSDRGTPTIKQEPSPSYSGSENSNLSSPNQSPRSPHSPSSPLVSGEVDEENRMRKRRRVAVPPAIGSNNIKVTNNPEVMEQVRNTLKLKQQQKAIIEARQQQAQQQMLQQQNFADRRHTSQSAWESNRTTNTLSKRTSVSNRSNRNSRNLSVFAPPYNDISSLSSTSPGISKARGQNSAGLTNNRQPMTAPITLNRSAPNKQNVSGFPLSANSAFRPTSQSQTLNTHSASTSASINGLISPHNIEDIRSNSVSSSPLPLPSPIPRLSRISKSVTSPMSHTNGEQPSKESFIHLFDSFYDTVADTRSLKTTLEDQIRKTTTLLQTLQASGSMIESLVRGHFREMQREVVKDLMTLEKRLSKVEERMRSGAAVVGMSPSPPLDPDRRLSDISSASSDMGYSHNKNTSTFAQSTNNSSTQYSSISQPTHSSPPLSSVSSHSNAEESQPKDYEYILKALKARLESLERRMSVP